MCIRCDSVEEQASAGLCAPCAVELRAEAHEVLRRLERYLAAWADFDEWARRQEHLGD